jgi:hypothetical protein
MTVKKVTIEKKQLPPLSADGKYLLRYRIISEDKNRTSHWSPIYSLDASGSIEQVSSSIEVTNTGITVSWGDANDRSEYDIFVSYGILSGGVTVYEPYSYHGSSTAHSYSFSKKAGLYTSVQVEIHLSGIEKVRSEPYTLRISQTSKTLQPTIDGGSA